MKKNYNLLSNFQKKLTRVFLTGIIMLFTSKLTAQIIYVDIPDGVPSSIDFNSDGNPEFKITMSGSYLTYFPNNNIHAIGPAKWDEPDCVDFGFVIDASGKWLGYGDAFLDGWGGGNTTLPAPNTDKYLAVKFNLTGNNTNLYYGWIRISTSNTGDIIYKDYAYKSVPNTSI